MSESDTGSWLGAYSSKESVIEDFKGHVSPGKAEFFRKYGIDLIPGRREGACIYDVGGKKYLNFHCNGGVFNLGHRNPRVIAALKQALDSWDIGNHHLMSVPRSRLAARLAELMPGDITQTIFGVGGGEAIDLAIKVARSHTKRGGIVSAKGGYHGHTGFALAAGDEKFKAPFSPMTPGFSQVPFGDAAALEKAVGADTAAVIMETIPATLGIAVPPEDYFQAVRRICDDAGALMLIDEVQTGLGRTGKMWGIDHYGVVPDIIVLGKGLSGGIYPISATCCRAEVTTVFNEDPFIHISTFGGAEVGCFAALEVLEITSEPDFLKHVNEMSALFAKGLEALRKKFPEQLIEVRQKGLMMGLKARDEMHALLLVRFLYDSGVFVVFSANDTSVVQFLPPLIIAKEEAEEALARLEKALDALP